MIEISVVIPMYNSSDTIISCLDSVKYQTAISFIKEIIIVNDGSTDNSFSKVEIYKKNNPTLPIFIINKSNGGVSSARNLGIKKANGNWVALLDSDDQWHINKIEHQLTYISKYKEILAIGGNRDNEIINIGKKIENGLYRIDCITYLKKNWPHTSTFLINKIVFDKTGLFNEKMSHAEDGDLFMRIAHHFFIYYTIESLENCGDGKLSFGQSGLSKDLKKMHNGVLKMYNHAYELKYINLSNLFLLSIYENLKYIRRIIITKLIVK